jgi:glutaryl-CoA dehydrogenase
VLAGNFSLSAAVLALEMARVDVSSSTFFLVHSGLAMASIDICGTEEQKQRYIPAMAKLEKV